MNWDDYKKDHPEQKEEFQLPQSKSSVKIIKNTKGLNWEIKIVDGTPKEQIEALRNTAVEQHELMVKQLGTIGERIEMLNNRGINK